MGRLLRRRAKKSNRNAEREQAIEQARRCRVELTRQAVALRSKLGKLQEPQAELERALYVVEGLHPSIRRGLALADRARQAGDEPEARSYEETAGFLADSLGATLVSLKEAKILYDTALRSVEAAERAAEESASLLEEAQAGIDEGDRFPRPEDARPAVEVEQMRKEIEARYGRAIQGAEAACAAIGQRLAEPGSDDFPTEPPEPSGLSGL
ncbi:MAG: hypothetical protein ACRDJF_00420 [Actinomycetota bacterium]